MPVIITVRGNHKQFGIVRGFEGENACVVELLTRHEEERRQRHVTTVTASTAAIKAESSGEMVTVNSSSIRAASDLHVTAYQVEQAQRFGLNQFPGAFPTREGGVLSRSTRTEAEIVELMNHLENEEIFLTAEASRKNAEKGLKYLRALPICQSWKLYKQGCTDAGVRPIRYPSYLLLLSNSAYGLLKIVNCVCTICRILLFENCDGLRELVELLNLPTEVKKEFLKRIDWISRYLSVDYPASLRDESPSVYHCMCFALSCCEERVLSWVTP